MCPIAPAFDGKGPAWRAAWLLAALADTHDVSSHVVVASGRQRTIGALGALLRGRPAEVGWFMPSQAWRDALRATDGTDVMIAVTVRVVGGPVAVPLVVDHIDALSVNLAGRSRGPEPLPVRVAAAIEARLMKRWERRIASWSAAQFAICDADAAALAQPPRALVVGPVAPIGADPRGPRSIDVVLTGNMSYPPNREAAEWLDREVAPRIRASHPEAVILVAGRAADRLKLTYAQAVADVPSVLELLADSRVAVAPLRGIGTGIPIKMLEAAAAGAALVVSPWAHARLPLPARVADSASEMAARVVELLDDEPARSGLAGEASAALAGYGLPTLRSELELVLRAVSSGHETEGQQPHGGANREARTEAGRGR